ncbi:MAG TPA: hypothetical protein VEG62_05015 [Acidimicrobiales bacterium]|nr:hypothetical protein [Acidimicrobiales bacterium]
MRERWLSRRAVGLHLAAVVVVTGCALAAWWQITRAEDGNQLSYFYSVMWPAFGILAVYFWWSLIHTDFESAGRRGVERQQAHEQARARLAHGAHAVQATTEAPPARGGPAAGLAPFVNADEDPELAAYNARLAQLATQGPKTWRRR